MLVEDSNFWVVKPRIGREGISGLNTVLSGAYLQLEPGQSHEEARTFEVRDQPPVAPPGAEGLRINLVSQVATPSVSATPSPSRLHRGPRRTGRLRRRDATNAPPHLHREPLSPPDHVQHPLLEQQRHRPSARLPGVRVQVESIEALLGGGVTFGVPEDLPRGETVEPDTTFKLFADEESARQAPSTATSSTCC